MNRFAPFLALLAGIALFAGTTFADPINVAEDDASHSAYNGGWSSDANGGSGFGKWTFATETSEGGYAGFYIATKSNNPDLTGIAREEKAFGIFANGPGFEQAVAFRPFDKPLEPGDSFSIMLETGPFEKKGETDSGAGGGSAGVVLRSGNANGKPADYNAGALIEFGHYEGKPNYQIYDGSPSTDSGVPVDNTGVIVTATITGSDTYDLEIQTAQEKKLTKLSGRKLGGTGTVESMALFNRNSEKADVYFNQLQVNRPAL